MESSFQRGVASVEVAGAILRALRGAQVPLSLQDLVGLTGMTAPRLHHYLVSLIRTELVRKATDGRYSLGAFALELGLAAADKLDTQHASASWLHQLSALTGEASFFAVASPKGPIIVRWEQGSRPLTVHARLGTVMPLLTSATGLAWLAFDPDNSVPVLERELRRIPPVERNAMRESRLAEAGIVNKSGIATALGTMIPNVNAIAAPVFSRGEKLVGILTLLGLGNNFQINANGKAVRLLKKISANLGDQLL